MKTKATTFNDVFAHFENDAEFKQAERRLKPYHDLVVEIIRRRTQLGLTQQDLANKSGTYQSRISKIESADHDIRLSTLVDIAEALDCEVAIHLMPHTDGKPIPVSDFAKAYGLFSAAASATTTASEPIVSQINWL